GTSWCPSLCSGLSGPMIGSRNLTVQRAAIAGLGGMMRWPVWRVAVAERSMEPALMPGDWLLAWRGWRGGPGGGGGRAVGGGRPPEQPDVLLVKRVAWQEPDGWWLDSDNRRAGSVDSSRFGPVRSELIEARVVTRYWPLVRRRQRGSGPSGPEPRTCG